MSSRPDPSPAANRVTAPRRPQRSRGARAEEGKAMDRWLVPGLVAFLMVLEMALSMVAMRDVTREAPPAPMEVVSDRSPLAAR